MGVFLPYKALPGLKDYKYSSEDHSLVSKYVLKPFYTAIVPLFPLWVAPNLITLSGLVFTFAGVLLATYYNPYYDTEAPRWVYFAYAAQLFLYQTFDAIDGLQARRTGTSSPLGELFDHTVDAINTTFGVITFGSAVNMNPWLILGAEFGTTLNFYLSTWEEYHTGTLYLSIFSGPVEGVLMIVGMEIITGFTGPDLWNTPVVYGYTFNDLYIPGFAAALLFNVVAAVHNVNKSFKKNGQSNYGKVLHQVLPFFVLWGGFFSWVHAAPYLVYDHLTVILLVAGINVAFMVGRIITAHVTHQTEFPMWNVLISFPYLAVAAHYLAPVIGWSVITVDYAVLWLVFGLSLGIHLYFVFEIITEITEYLGIKALTIPYRPKTD